MKAGSQSSPLAASFEQPPKLADAFEASERRLGDDVPCIRLPSSAVVRFIETFAKTYGLELAEIASRSYLEGRKDAELADAPPLNATATECGASMFRLLERIADRNRQPMDDA